MNEDIYISLGISEVEDWEHNAPLDVRLNIIVVDKEALKEEKYSVGDLAEMFMFLEI
jgi:hypothetical protein